MYKYCNCLSRDLKKCLQLLGYEKKLILIISIIIFYFSYFYKIINVVYIFIYGIYIINMVLFL